MTRFGHRSVLLAATGLVFCGSMLTLHVATAQQPVAQPSVVVENPRPGANYAIVKDASGTSGYVVVSDLSGDGQIGGLLSTYAQAGDDKEKARILQELTKLLMSEFDRRQETRERELKELEDQVKKLRDLQQRRMKEKDQIVQDRIRQLLRDQDGLGWGVDQQGIRLHYAPVAFPAGK